MIKMKLIRVVVIRMVVRGSSSVKMVLIKIAQTKIALMDILNC